MSNLFIADASAFPTGGAVSPMPTILALALRPADHLEQERWRPLPVDARAEREEADAGSSYGAKPCFVLVRRRGGADEVANLVLDARQLSEARRRPARCQRRG